MFKTNIRREKNFSLIKDEKYPIQLVVANIS
jgi:hypothetical protein